MSRWITIEAAELAVKAVEEENARLKAQVERLTKAGDVLADKLWETGCQCQDCEEVCDNWNAVKESIDAQ